MEFLDKRIVSLSGVLYLNPKESQFIELKKASLILPLLGDKHFEQTGLYRIMH